MFGYIGLWSLVILVILVLWRYWLYWFMVVDRGNHMLHTDNFNRWSSRFFEPATVGWQQFRGKTVAISNGRLKGINGT